jgi:Protein of unknown function DUF262
MVDEIFEPDAEPDLPDPDQTPIRDRKLVTQPYDLAVQSLITQIDNKTIFLRPMSERPRFQRNYVWTDKLASKLIESILLQVPIPPCFLSQNEEYELDVVDGQQRLFSIYRFTKNSFELSGLDVLSELNGLRFLELSPRVQKQLSTFSVRCIVITNESHPEVKFEVFERLNTNTVPLNSQELRNCVYRGRLNEYLKDASEMKDWLEILGRKSPDKRLRDEELVLRFFAYSYLGIESYRTPQKIWLNEAASVGRTLSQKDVENFRSKWTKAIAISRIWFDPNECFRRPGLKSLNRALFDLIMHTAAKTEIDQAQNMRAQFRDRFFEVIADEQFSDLVSRAVDHRSRTLRRFEIWEQALRAIS